MLQQRINSFKYAFKGIFDLFRSQPNALIHLLAAVVAIVAGFYFSISTTEWAIVLLTIFLVLAAEALNTAIEYLTDLVSPEYHELAGKTKDAAAAGVLLVAMGAIAVAAMIFLPKILAN
ncbi:MAG: diacylglycerol kinase [Paraglaciecola sp.]|jgi:diacylglycerol kinase